MQNKRESVLTFIALLFALSIPFWLLDAIHPIQLLPGVPLSALGAFAPGLAALVLICRNEGRSGVIQLLRRSFDFKRVKKKIWYFAVILINPAIAVLAYVIMRVLGVSLPNPTLLTITIFPLFLVFFIAALGEEIGWTGYATEPLQHQWGILGAGVSLGLVWAVFHFIPLLQVQRSLEWIGWWSLGTVSLRLIMGWLYSYSGKSVFAATVFHAMVNLCWQLFPINGSYYDPQVFSLITLGFAIAMFTIGRLGAKSHLQAT